MCSVDFWRGFLTACAAGLQSKDGINGSARLFTSTSGFVMKVGTSRNNRDAAGLRRDSEIPQLIQYLRMRPHELQSNLLVSPFIYNLYSSPLDNPLYNPPLRSVDYRSHVVV